MIKNIDVDLLKQYISYNPDDGLFTRHTLCKNDHRSAIGPLLNTDTGGYIIFSVLSESYLAHKLAFAFMGEEIPDLVDHKNRIRNDNRWLNLRVSSKAGNAQNRSLSELNRSGYTGVIYDSIRSKYRTYIRINGKSYTAGRFKDIDDAVEAITQLKIKLLGENYVS